MKERAEAPAVRSRGGSRRDAEAAQSAVTAAEAARRIGSGRRGNAGSQHRGIDAAAAPPAEPAAAASPAERGLRPKPSGLPGLLRPPKQGGQGKSDSSRSRSSRQATWSSAGQ